MKEIDFTKIKKVWLVGIKGTGMTSLAQILSRYDIQVSGSDTDEIFFTDEVLKSLGIDFKEKFSPDNISDDIDLLVYSTAYSADNVEIAEAKNKNIPILSLPEMHGLLMKEKMSIAVSGTHGKTTTTAVLGYVLQQSDFDPTVIVGAPIPQFNGSALIGGSKYLVIEACEYQNKFQYYNPTCLIVNNIEYDHPDFFTCKEDFFKTFVNFAKKVPDYGFIVANVDDVKVQELITQVNKEIITFGTVPSAEWRIESDFNYTGSLAQGFVIFKDNNLWGKGETNLWGQFNLLNILAAVVAAVKLGVNQEAVIKAIKRFRPPKRRFEYKGTTSKGAVVMDDFAHHPTALQVTLRALREHYPDKQITAVFHPHTFTRTRALFDDFARSFKDVNKVIVLDIYGSVREKQGTVSSEQLVEAINVHSNNAVYLPTKQEALDYLRQQEGKDRVFITMGAGDVWKIANALIDKTNLND